MMMQPSLFKSAQQGNLPIGRIKSNFRDLVNTLKICNTLIIIDLRSDSSVWFEPKYSFLWTFTEH